MQTGQTRYGTEVLHVPAVHKDGRTMSIAFTVALLYTPDKKPRVIAAILRDETRRWEEERALHHALPNWKQGTIDTASRCGSMERE
jgi:hypothetical protein